MKRPSVAETARNEAAARAPVSQQKTADRTKILGVRLSPDEYRRVRDFFEAQGVPAATGVRMILLNHLRDHGA